MDPILERLIKGEILVADGAMGSMLFQRGLKSGECPESLNISKPEVLEEIARLYFEAGADIVQTNTFGGSPMKLGDYGKAEQTATFNMAAAACVRKSVGKKAFISGSVGPSGKILKPYGDADPTELSEGFRLQIKALVDGGVDILCVETMTDLNEATLAVRAAKAIAPHIPVMATMTFDATSRGFFTVMGVSVEQAAMGLTEAGAEIIGSNCGNGIENMVQIAQVYRQVSNLPILIQANAGKPEMKEGNLVYPETPEFFKEKVPDLIDAGVSIIGGCCGSTPEHIQAIRQVVDANKR
jgi:5-methyltetrahydrofolate--homocysteine methyltransferase